MTQACSIGMSQRICKTLDRLAFSHLIERWRGVGGTATVRSDPGLDGTEPGIAVVFGSCLTVAGHRAPVLAQNQIYTYMIEDRLRRLLLSPWAVDPY